MLDEGDSVLNTTFVVITFNVVVWRRRRMVDSDLPAFNGTETELVVALRKGDWAAASIALRDRGGLSEERGQGAKVDARGKVEQEELVELDGLVPQREGELLVGHELDERVDSRRNDKVPGG